MRIRIEILPEQLERFTEKKVVMVMLMLNLLLRYIELLEARHCPQQIIAEAENRIKNALEMHQIILPRQRVTALLIASGRRGLLLFWVELIGDMVTLINLLYTSCDYEMAIKKLAILNDPEQYYRMGARMMRVEPQLFAEHLIIAFNQLQLLPQRLIPVVASYEFSPTHAEHYGVKALRYMSDQIE